MTYLGEGGLADIKARVYRERGSVALNGNGQATITFANPVNVADNSHIQLTAWSSTGLAPIVVNPISWVESGGQRTGVVIEAARLRELPSSITVLTLLFSFRVWLGTSASGASVDWMLY